MLSSERVPCLSIIALEVDVSRNGRTIPKLPFPQVDEESNGVVLGEWKRVSEVVNLVPTHTYNQRLIVELGRD